MVNCPSCGAPVDLHLENCPYCGCVILKEKKTNETPATHIATPIEELLQDQCTRKKKYNRNKSTAAILAFFLGGFGADDFYLGNTTSGLIWLIGTLIISSCTFGIWLIIAAIAAIVRMCKYISMSEEDFDNKYNY